MQVLKTVSNIKIPYPTEGIIRTAQLDDTISPEESVELAVNMNFDRVGATQTRLGVTEYADSLGEEITNFGTLRNSIIPTGYANIFQIGESNELADEFTDPAAVKISDTKMAVFWSGSGSDGFCQNFEIDLVNGSMIPMGSPLEFDTVRAIDIRAIKVTSSIVLVVWSGSGSDGFAQCFNVGSDSITAMGTPLEFDTSNANDITISQVDATHFICFYTGASNVGLATIFEVDTGTGAVTEPGSTLTFEAGVNFANSSCALGDGTHFINTWMNAGGAQVQVFEVNTGTWAITALSSALNYTTNMDRASLLPLSDNEHFVNIYQGGAPSGKWAQAFEVNTSTWAITTVGTGLRFATSSGNDTVGVSYEDDEHFVAFYSLNVGFGYVQMLEMDPTTFDFETAGLLLSEYDFANGGYTTAVLVDTDKVIAVWGNVDGIAGTSAMFQSFGELVSGKWLFAAHGDEVSSWNGSSPWVSRRSGLQQVSKPRFAQYLGYLWMVNGNSFIGGDPVMTSNGGAFGTDLVPENFPAGDLISAGFEGRVWVVNTTLGIIYYSDIVQFIPPSVYSLTYDPEVNFITTISPQTGEKITAIYEVPRALLIFTENTITRIYGATSIDAYPAYQVGTFSQESIIETKTGIFFHHSSGFYQFDYGSQPIEISRRIIDFVKAIPRSYYEDVTGVYDGFDCVEWSVGPITVSGVTFSNCVLRYTISTQVWTVYDYPGNTISALVLYDNGTAINHIMGTSAGKVGALDTGYTDFGLPYYFEYIDRWRGYTEMYYQTKSITGINIYSENAAGANFYYQQQKSGANAWKSLGTVTEANNSLIPNAKTEDFDVIRFRLAGQTSGTPIVVHGIEILKLEIKGQNQN